MSCGASLYSVSLPTSLVVPDEFGDRIWFALANPPYPVLLFVLWYCHKRGREVRLEREKSGRPEESDGRIEELPDDLALPAPESTPSGNRTPVTVERERERIRR